MKTLQNFRTDIKTGLTATGRQWHVYGKGYRGRRLFLEESDYIVFLALLKQCLRLQGLADVRRGTSRRRITLYAYGLADNNYQLLLNDGGDETGLQRLIHGVLVSYTGYYHRKYRLKGALLSDVYKSTKIENAPLLVELSVAIHRLSGSGWRQSSRNYYEGKGSVDWVSTAEITRLAGGKADYAALLHRGEPSKRRTKR